MMETKKIPPTTRSASWPPLVKWGSWERENDEKEGTEERRPAEAVVFLPMYLHKVLPMSLGCTGRNLPNFHGCIKKDHRGAVFFIFEILS